MLNKLRRLLCRFRHNYEPLVLQTGLQTHRCTRCGDERQAFVIMPGESIIIETETKFTTCLKEHK